MCLPLAAVAAAGAVLSAGASVYGGMAARTQGQYEQAVAQENRKAEIAAGDDARNRGAIEEQRRYRALAQQLGTQRAAQAASGLDVGFGSPADLLGDTRMIGYEDINTIRQNTKREVEGFDVRAANYTTQGNAARARGNAAFTGSLLSAGGSLLGSAKQIFGK